MDITIYDSDVHTVRAQQIKAEHAVKLTFETGPHSKVLVWLTDMQAQRLTSELARLYPAPALTDSDVDHLAGRYAESHAGDVGVHLSDCPSCGGRGYVVGWNSENQRASLACAVCQGQGSLPDQAVRHALAMEAS